MTTQQAMAGSGSISIGNEKPEDQDPTPESDEQPADEHVVNITRPKHQPAPAKEPTKDAPSFPPGSPETVPPGPTSA